MTVAFLFKEKKKKKTLTQNRISPAVPPQVRWQIFVYPKFFSIKLKRSKIVYEIVVLAQSVGCNKAQIDMVQYPIHKQLLRDLAKNFFGL